MQRLSPYVGSDRRFLRWLGTGLSIVLVTWINFALQRATGGWAPFLPYFPALALIGLFAGSLQGVVATLVMAVLVDLFWIGGGGPDVPGVQPREAVALAVFIVAGLSVVAASVLARRALLRVERAQARVVTAHRSSRIVEWEWDIASDRFSFLDQPRQVLGTDSVLGRELIECLHPDDRAQASAAVAAGLERGRYTFTARIRRPDNGELRWIETIAVVHRERGGPPTRVTGTTQDVTEKQALLEELHAGDRRFRMALQTASIIAWESDAARRFTWVHGPGERFAPAGLVGKPIAALLEGEASQPYLHALDEAWASGVAQRVPVSWSVAGKMRHYLASISPINDLAGRTLGMASAAVDVTALRQAQEVAQASEAKFSRAFDASPDSLTISHLGTGVIVEANPKFMALCGRRAEDVIGQTSTDLGLFIDPRDRTRAVEMLRRDGNIRDLELQINSLSRGVRTVLLSVERLPSAEDDDLIVSILQDVSEQKQLESARLASERLLRLALEGAQLGTWTTELDSQVTHCSARNREIFGLSATEGTPLPIAEWRDRVLPEDRERLREAWRAIHATREPFALQYRIQRPDGSVRWVETSGQFQLDADGAPLRTFGITADVTERKVAEMLVREESARKDEFIATLAHELRNPLAPIRYASRLLRGEVAPAQQQDIGRMIERQLANMSHLLDDLLDVSRISRGTLALRTEALDLREIVAAAVEDARPLASAVGHELVAQIADEPLPLAGDPTRLAQILSNLLHNATRYTEPGGRIVVRAFAERREVVVEVGDNGIGIAQEQLPRIFELFQQGDRSSHAVGGLGIGLALARRFAQLHGGTLEARSGGRGQGSVFLLRLRRAAQEPAAATELGRRMATVGGARADGERVLVVDDNVDAADSLAMVLRLAGYTAHTAYDGASAIELADIVRPSTILLDLGLPNLSGHEVARRIRDLPWGKSVRLIAITGWGRDDDRRRTRDAGFDHHLTKPVEADAVLRLIAEPARRATA